MKRAALSALFLSMLALGVAYAAVLLAGGTPPWAPWLMALAAASATTATMMLGAARPGRPPGRLGFVFAFVFIVVAGGFALAFVLPGVGEPLWLGLPRRAAIILYGVALLPLFVVPLAYAWTFDELTLTEDDLERIDELKRQNAEAAGTTGESAG